MAEYYLAIDIGASSGRHVISWIEDGTFKMEEVYRFPNGMNKVDGSLCWDVKQLFTEILTGMIRCKEMGKVPVSMGIDTWAVDFVLLDEKEQILGKSVGYRDSRTEGMDALVYDIIPEKELYGKTGIQKQIFNTIYQLMAVKTKNPEHLAKAKSFLMIPDYFHYLLTGIKSNEYTNATTTQLVSPVTKDWDFELIERLGYPREIFGAISEPGTVLGTLSKEVQDFVGFNCKVILPATHDTGSAVVSVPAKEDMALYISSGTWSLMGIELKEADCSEESQLHNFTNEGGYQYRFRYLKNIMGLWMIQSLRKEIDNKYSFAELCQMAETSDLESIVDCNLSVFLAPESMMEAIKSECIRTNQPVPETTADYARVIYRSLAECYKTAAKEIEEKTGHTFDCIYIVGGGANAEYLNQLTAKSTKKTIYAGPTEATAIGNLAVQMMAEGTLGTLAEARACIKESFQIKTYN